MAFRLQPSKKMGREVRRVARERLDLAIDTLDGIDGAAPEAIEEAVHSVRKRCKEVRGLARLVRPALGDGFRRFDRLVRDAAAELASVRDAHAVLATFDQVRRLPHDHDDNFEVVRAGQDDLARSATGALRSGDRRIVRARSLLVRARRKANEWDLPAGFDPLSDGLRATYRRGRTSFHSVVDDPTDEGVHEWRKSVKRLWYQVRLLEASAPSVLGPMVESLDRLGEALGDDHDLAVMIERLRADPDRYGGKQAVRDVRRHARRQQRELRARAFRLADTVYAEPPGTFVTRIEAYWTTSIVHGPEREVGGIDVLVTDALDTDVAAAEGTSVERERKYLVPDPPDLPSGTRMRQGYLAVDRDVSLRVRDAGTSGCTMTLKSGRGAVRTEVEVPIDLGLFEQLWSHTDGRRISKVRSMVPLGTLVAEVDTYGEELAGLVVVEVEFDDEATMAAFTPPTWFGPEVTDDVRYSNAELALRGLDRKLFAAWAPPADGDGPAVGA